MSNIKTLANRTVRVVWSEEPDYEGDTLFADAVRLAEVDLGPIVSGKIVLRNERGDEYILTFDDNE
jgi:hypothetical protein